MSAFPAAATERNENSRGVDEEVQLVMRAETGGNRVRVGAELWAERHPDAQSAAVVRRVTAGPRESTGGCRY